MSVASPFENCKPGTKALDGMGAVQKDHVWLVWLQDIEDQSTR